MHSESPEVEQVLSGKQGAATLSVAAYGTLVALKLAVGLAIGSVSVISEAVHSAVDLPASLMGLIAVRASIQPPDRDHPFGHGKAESLGGAVQALLILGAALLILNESIQKLLHGVELGPVDLGIGVMLVSAAVNAVAARWITRVARATDSLALEASALNHSSDVLISLGVAIGLVAVRLTGLAVLDPLIAIGVALVICKAAYDIARRSLRDLLDVSLPEDEQERIREVLELHREEIADYHRVRSRKSGAERHVDLHLVVRRNATVQESHDLCDHLEEHLQDVLGPVSLNIHVEPCDDSCDRCRVDDASKRQAG